MKYKQKNGFALIELMVVVAIVGILASIATLQFTSLRVKAYNMAAASDIEKGVVTMEVFYANHYAYPNDHAIFSGSGDMALTNGVQTMPWAISDGVSSLYTKGSPSGYCIIAKHFGGNTIFMASDAYPSPVPLSMLAKESSALQDPGSVVGTVDCARMDAATIATISVGG